MIDPRAIIDPSAKLGENVQVGPWTMIGPDVEIGDDTVIASHVVIKGPTRIGRGNRIYQFATVGEDTPDLKYQGEATTLVMGDHNVVREGVTIHRGTVQDKGETRIGSHNLLMAYVHVGHDCVLGDHGILVNNASLAGHVHLGDWVILSGYTLVHQYVSFGAHSFAGAGSYVVQDVPPYVTVTGNPASPRTVNSEGLKRRGFSVDQITAIKRAYKILYRKGLKLDEARAQLEAMAGDDSAIRPMVTFIDSTRRGLAR